MKIDSSGFQPASLFNQLFKKNDKATNASALSSTVNLTDKVKLGAKLMNDRLAESLQIPAEKKLSNDLFDFEEVAKNVLGFVQNAVLKAKGKGESQEQLQSMLDQAREGIKIGIEEATEELEESGLLTDDIKVGIANSEKLMSEGLDEFEKSLFESLPPISNYREASSYSLTNGASLNIRTQEGDEIAITFNSSYQHNSAAGYQGSAQGGSYASYDAKSYASSFSFEVTGDLNEQEQQAINEIMADLQQVSDSFFSGSLDEAFEKALDINMDTSQLASFSMNLQQTESLASIKEYQAVLPGARLANQLAPINDGLEQAFNKAVPLGIEQELSGILQWLNQEREQADKFIAYSQSIFDHLQQIQEQ